LTKTCHLCYRFVSLVVVAAAAAAHFSFLYLATEVRNIIRTTASIKEKGWKIHCGGGGGGGRGRHCCDNDGSWLTSSVVDESILINNISFPQRR